MLVIFTGINNAAILKIHSAGSYDVLILKLIAANGISYDGIKYLVDDFVIVA